MQNVGRLFMTANAQIGCVRWSVFWSVGRSVTHVLANLALYQFILCTYKEKGKYWSSFLLFSCSPKITAVHSFVRPEIQRSSDWKTEVTNPPSSFPSPNLTVRLEILPIRFIRSALKLRLPDNNLTFLFSPFLFFVIISIFIWFRFSRGAVGFRPSDENQSANWKIRWQIKGFHRQNPHERWFSKLRLVTGCHGRARSTKSCISAESSCIELVSREKSLSQSSTFWHIREKQGFHFLMGKLRVSTDRMRPQTKLIG